MYELERQGITTYLIWPSIHDLSAAKGVSRAHKQIVRWAKEQELAQVTIMEDDIKFPGPNGYKWYLNNMLKNFDLYLGGIYRGEIIEGKVKDFSSLHLYTISAKFYDTFLSVDESKHLDTALANLGDYHVCYPFAAIQYSGYSDVERGPTNFEGLLKNKLIYSE
jgi:hypothetical protein